MNRRQGHQAGNAAPVRAAAAAAAGGTVGSLRTASRSRLLAFGRSASARAAALAAAPPSSSSSRDEEPSSDGLARPAARPSKRSLLPSLHKFARGSGGSLGLSKSELDRRCRPSGLYDTCEWDEKAVRRLIGDGKLAARLEGSDTRSRPSDRECPVCFLRYSQTNIALCCGANLCTECYLQIRPQRQGDSPCPFCNNPKLAVAVAHTVGRAYVALRDEARIRARRAREAGGGPSRRVLLADGDGSGRRRLSGDGDGGWGGDGGGSGGGARRIPMPVATPVRAQSTRRLSATSASASPSDGGGFGYSLEAHAVVQRTLSGDGDDGHHDVDSSAAAAAAILTPSERRATELSVSAQTSHASWRRAEEEADVRRAENEGRFSSARHRQQPSSRLDADRALLRAHGIPVRCVGRIASDSQIVPSGGPGLMHEILPPRPTPPGGSGGGGSDGGASPCRRPSAIGYSAARGGGECGDTGIGDRVQSEGRVVGARRREASNDGASSRMTVAAIEADPSPGAAGPVPASTTCPSSRPPSGSARRRRRSDGAEPRPMLMPRPRQPRAFRHASPAYWGRARRPSAT